MKYVVRCFYCDKEFEVRRGETGADFICPECGGKNSIRDVIERIEEESDKKKDEDIQAIQEFDLAKHRLEDNSAFSGYEKKEIASKVWIGIIIVIILCLCRTIDIMFSQ